MGERVVEDGVVKKKCCLGADSWTSNFFLPTKIEKFSFGLARTHFTRLSDLMQNHNTKQSQPSDQTRWLQKHSCSQEIPWIQETFHHTRNCLSNSVLACGTFHRVQLPPQSLASFAQTRGRMQSGLSSMAVGYVLCFYKLLQLIISVHPYCRRPRHSHNTKVIRRSLLRQPERLHTQRFPPTAIIRRSYQEDKTTAHVRQLGLCEGHIGEQTHGS